MFLHLRDIKRIGRDFLFKPFAHCNRIDSLEGIVCSLHVYGIMQDLSVSLMFLNREVLAAGRNANIQTFWEKMITHTRNHGLTTRLRLHRQTYFAWTLKFQIYGLNH
jgi:hypothetical protein